MGGGFDLLPFCFIRPLCGKDYGMWIVKGSLLGTGLFLVGSIIYVFAMFDTSTAQAVGTTAIQSWTIQNPLYWTVLVATLVIGCVVCPVLAIKT
jgi:RsiW-degrading membrane proteinase PrsW (M82 family)